MAFLFEIIFCYRQQYIFQHRCVTHLYNLSIIQQVQYLFFYLHHISVYMNRIDKIKEMLATSPTDNFLQHALALEYTKIDEDQKARILFENILTASPDYIGSYYHLAKLLERSGERNAAIECYEKGMQAAKAAGDMHAYNELQSAYEDLIY